MGFITDVFSETVKYGKRTYHTCAVYDNVLAVQKAYKDQELEGIDKVNIALRLLIRERFSVWALEDKKKIELLELIVKKQIELPRHPPARKKERILDFELDGEYIFASFYQAYRIDLIEQQGKLHWKKFIALFQGLPDSTKIREVMKIRSMELPPYNGKNGKEIQQIQEMKSYYALPVQGGGGQNGLDRLFATLESQAVKNE